MKFYNWCYFLDGCAALYHIHWPKDAKVEDFLDSFVLYTSELLQSAAVCLIFDRYIALKSKQDWNDLVSICAVMYWFYLQKRLEVDPFTLRRDDSEIHQN